MTTYRCINSYGYRKKLQHAITHHQAGQLDDAEQCYRSILQREPEHPDTNHNFGLLKIQQEQTDEALTLFLSALNASPSAIPYWVSYIDALIYTEQLDLAENLLKLGRSNGLAGEAFDQLDILLAEAHYNIGITLKALGQLSARVKNIEKALAIRPDYAEAHNNLAMGSGSTMIADQLIYLEQKYGGHVRGFHRVISLPDQQTPKQKARLRAVPHEGGDRMSSRNHNYALVYANCLRRFNPKVIVEVGILSGIGLAMWCDMFPDARIIGLDITMDHFDNNRDDLVARGAFQNKTPETYLFDQYQDNTQLLKSIIRDDTIDFMIDDGAHTPLSIIETYNSAKELMSDEFYYLVEDFHKTKHILSLKETHEYGLSNDGLVTVIQDK